MKWLKRTVIALAVLLVIAAIVPFFVSLNDYIPQIEKAASLRLGEPVSIKSMRVAVLPTPHVTIDGITIGKSDEVKVGKVQASPELASLLQSAWVIQSIDIDSLYIEQKGLERLSALGGAGMSGQNEHNVIIRKLRFRNAQIKYGKAVFGPFEARVDLDERLVPNNAEIASQDGKIKALINSKNNAYQFDIKTKNMQLPLGPPLLFNELNIKGTATLKKARLEEITARLYGGTATGHADISWQKKLRLKGSLGINHLELRQIVPMLSPNTRLSGRLDAKPVFSASAASAKQLLNALRLETPFSIKNGVLGGVDIKKATTELSKKGSSGGETRFEQLSGKLSVERDGYHFTQISIASGNLKVEGQVDVSRKKQLSGRIHAQVPGLSVPLTVAGTTDKPFLYPSGAAVTGAAIGTVILGPGLGTSVGAKVGNWLEGVFGKKDKKKPESK